MKNNDRVIFTDGIEFKWRIIDGPQNAFGILIENRGYYWMVDVYRKDTGEYWSKWNVKTKYMQKQESWDEED